MQSKLSKLFQSFGKSNKKKDSTEEEAPVKKEEPKVEEVPSKIIQPAVTVTTNPTPESIAKSRRRLSVDGEDTRLDGFVDVDMEVELPQKEANIDDVFVGVFAGKSQKGYTPYNPRKVNQDWMLIREDSASGTLVLGTFDGHGEHGHCISEFICTNFYNHLIAHPKFLTSLREAATESLARAEEECNNNRFIKTEFSGTTAVVCILRGNMLITINVGDSRAILASEMGEECVITELTHDHKPNLPEEKERIEKAGGRVFAMKYDDGYEAPPRVWLADQDIPGLAMSRSICDTVAHSVGVVSTPEIYERKLNMDDRVIVMGSDGLWEFIPNDEVISIIEDCEQPEDAVERLATIAWKRWFDHEQVVDDTTIIVVFLGRMDMQM